MNKRRQMHDSNNRIHCPHEDCKETAGKHSDKRSENTLRDKDSKFLYTC